MSQLYRVLERLGQACRAKLADRIDHSFRNRTNWRCSVFCPKFSALGYDAQVIRHEPPRIPKLADRVGPESRDDPGSLFTKLVVQKGLIKISTTASVISGDGAGSSLA